MKAGRYHAALDFRIEDIDPPSDTLHGDEVRIRVHGCGICGSDLHEYSHGPVFTEPGGHRITGIAPPVTLGHEFSGIVQAVGPEVRRTRVGDRVSVMPVVFCGRCEQCMAGRQQTCLHSSNIGYTTQWGGFAEEALLNENQVFTLPDEVSDSAGAMVEPAAVAVQAVAVAALRPGDVVLVTGGGPIGQLVAMAARAGGAGAVVLSEPTAARRAIAESVGVTVTVDPMADDVVDAVRGVAGGRMADVCIECAGGQAALDSCLAAVKPGGTIVQVAAGNPVRIDTMRAVTMRDVTIRGTFCYPVTSWPRVLSLIASGQMPVERILTGVIGLDEIVSEGFQRLLDPDGTDVKILVEL